MTLSLNIGNLFNDSSSHALVDELRKRTSEEDILDFEEKFNSKNEKNLHVYICLLYTSPSPRDPHLSRMPSSA